jgi:crossover junction endodeoxyribonuclease RuvC
MLVLGIDPGTATTGFCILNEADKKVTVLSCGVITTPKTEPQQKRLSMIYEKVMGLITKYKPDSMAVEKLFFGTNTKTAMKVGEARGTILLAASESGLALAEYSPMDVKIALTGYGKADKNQVQQMVKRLLNLKDIPRPDDAADAAAVALCHINTAGFNDKISRQQAKAI